MPVKYSQEAQATALNLNIELLNQKSVSSIFLWDLMEKQSNDILSPGIIKYDPKGMWTRKLSFYIYQSFTVS